MSFLFADGGATAGSNNSNINSEETMVDSASTAENTMEGGKDTIGEGYDTMGGGDDIGEEEDHDEGTQWDTNPPPPQRTSQPRHRVIATDQGTSSHQQLPPGTTDGPARTKQLPGIPGQGPAETKQFKLLLLRILTVVVIVAAGIAACKDILVYSTDEVIP